MLLPSIDLDDPLLPPQAPSVGLASHSTSAGSHPSGHLAAGQVFAAHPSADANVPASNQFVPGAAAVPLIAQPHTAQPQQVFSVPGPQDQDLAPPQSAAHSAAYEVSYPCLPVNACAAERRRLAVSSTAALT